MMRITLERSPMYVKFEAIDIALMASENGWAAIQAHPDTLASMFHISTHTMVERSRGRLHLEPDSSLSPDTIILEVRDLSS